MNDFTTLSVAQDGAVDWLTLNRPERRNALDAAMVRELWAYFDGLQNDYARRVVVMRGAGKGFCAGLDLKWFSEPGAAMPAGATDAGQGRRWRTSSSKCAAAPRPSLRWSTERPPAAVSASRSPRTSAWPAGAPR